MWYSWNSFSLNEDGATKYYVLFKCFVFRADFQNQDSFEHLDMIM